MAAEIVLVVGFLSLLSACVAILIWDIKRRRLSGEEGLRTAAELQLRVAELEKENWNLKEQLRFLAELARDPGDPDRPKGKP